MNTTNIADYHLCTKEFLKICQESAFFSRSVGDPDLVSVSLMTFEVLRHGGDHEEDLGVAVRDLHTHLAVGCGAHGHGIILVILNISIHDHNSG